ncbi:MAG TPA: zinc ribbon domain-containing protein [Thermoplasmata archaeon]
MICPACGTWNRDEARFCKYCGTDFSKVTPAAAPAPPVPAPAAPPPAAPAPPPPAILPRPPPARAWWHGLGIFLILALFFLTVDLGTTGHVTWSFVVVLSVAFIVGAVMILGFLASPARVDRRPFVAGAALLIVAVFLLPLAVALQSSPTTTDTYTVPSAAGVTALHLVVTNDVGRIHVRFAAGASYAARAEITHIGGVFSSHYPGDVTTSNATSAGTLTVSIATRGASALFFFGGHEIVVDVNAGLRFSMALTSTTGNILVEVPSGVGIAASAPGGGPSLQATVTTGSITLTTTDAQYAAGAHVVLTSTTGSVTMTVDAPRIFPGLVSVAGTSTTGNVDFAFAPGSGVAARVASSVTTGSVHSTPAYTGTSTALLFNPSSAAYDAAPMQFDVSLTTTTGSINLG